MSSHFNFYTPKSGISRGCSALTTHCSTSGVDQVSASLQWWDGTHWFSVWTIDLSICTSGIMLELGLVNRYYRFGKWSLRLWGWKWKKRKWCEGLCWSGDRVEKIQRSQYIREKTDEGLGSGLSPVRTNERAGEKCYECLLVVEEMSRRRWNRIDKAKQRRRCCVRQ